MDVQNQIKLDWKSGHTMAMFGSTLASSQIIESVCKIDFDMLGYFQINLILSSEFILPLNWYL